MSEVISYFFYGERQKVVISLLNKSFAFFKAKNAIIFCYDPYNELCQKKKKECGYVVIVYFFT